MLQVLIPVLVDKIFDRLVQTPANPIERTDAPVTKPEIKEVVEKELIPAIEHQTNNEPWYQSRVTLGSLASIIAGALGLFGYAVGVEDILTILAAATPILGGLFALYGRWKATKPLSVTK